MVFLRCLLCSPLHDHKGVARLGVATLNYFTFRRLLGYSTAQPSVVAEGESESVEAVGSVIFLGEFVQQDECTTVMYSEPTS